VVCLGGDRVIGTHYVDVLRLFEDDSDTDLIILIGEPGGGLEYAAAEYAATMRTPVVAYITGQGSPQDARMGHAGAVVGEDERSRPQNKMKAFASAGIEVARLVTDVGAIVSRRLEQAKTH
jgi:succinyl-CoA synthetase alpha subunit